MDLPSTAQCHDFLENYRNNMVLNLALCSDDDTRPNESLAHTFLTFDLSFAVWPHRGPRDLILLNTHIRSVVCAQVPLFIVQVKE